MPSRDRGIAVDLHLMKIELKNPFMKDRAVARVLIATALQSDSIISSTYALRRL